MPTLLRSALFLAFAAMTASCGAEWREAPPVPPESLETPVERVEEFTRLAVINMNHHTVSMFQTGKEYRTESFRPVIRAVSPTADQLLLQASRWEWVAWIAFGMGLAVNLGLVWRGKKGTLALTALTLGGALGLAAILGADDVNKQAHRTYFNDLRHQYLDKIPSLNQATR